MITVAGGILLALLVLASIPIALRVFGAMFRGVGAGVGLLTAFALAAVPMALLCGAAVYIAHSADTLVPGAGAYIGFAILIGLPAVAMMWDYRRLK